MAPAATKATWFEREVIELLPELYGCARSLADGPDEAEDAVAETVAKAWEHLDELRDRDRFRGWLFRILRNCCLGRRRRQAARPEQVPLRDEETEGPGFSLFDRLHQPFLLWWSNPEEEFLGGLFERDFKRALDELPPAYRDAVVLADVNELTYAEIADALQVPIGTVRSRLARGRSQLQERLWEHAVDAGLRDPSTHTTPEASSE